jgi:hypothetical protein
MPPGVGGDGLGGDGPGDGPGAVDLTPVGYDACEAMPHMFFPRTIRT